MLFSLIIGTLNRSTELKICLDSLLHQSINDFEVIIIDQSKNDLTQKLVKENIYDSLDIKYYHVDFKGLSKARNFGLSKSNGKYFALIDDDASYDKNYLLLAKEIFKKFNDIILSGHMVSKEGKDLCRYNEDIKKLSLRSIMRNTPSPGLIFPMKLLTDGVMFDERFGVGSEYGACEETDLILEALDKKYKVLYVRKMIFVHPTITHTFEIENTTKYKKIENYAVGFGALVAKDKIKRRSNRLWLIITEKILKLFIKRMGVLGKEKKQEALFEIKGILCGYKKYSEMYSSNHKNKHI